MEHHNMNEIKLFNTSEKYVYEITSGSISREKLLQTLFENNLERMIDVRFVKTEHECSNGRIDTLGIDKSNCPVIIEYKVRSNENIIIQGLNYLDWLKKHSTEFKMLVQDKMGTSTANRINYSSPRLICVAPNFNTKEINALNGIKGSVSLLRYRKFSDDFLILEWLKEINMQHDSVTNNPLHRKKSNRKKKGSKRILDYNTIMHENDQQKNRYDALRHYIFTLGNDIKEKQHKKYIAFQKSRNFACLLFRKDKILVYVDINPNDITEEENFLRSMREVAHHGTGDVEISISSDRDFERAKTLIKQSYKMSG